MTTVSTRETAAAPETAPVVRPRWRPPAKAVYGTAAVIVAIAAWWIVAALRIKPAIILPGPLDVIDAFRQLFSTSDIWSDLGTSAMELVLGLGLAALVGLPVGLLIGWYRRVSYILNPFVTFIYATPRIALTPLLIVWFGIGQTSKVAIVFLMAVFPIIINVATGMQSLDPQVLRVARLFGASDFQVFTTIGLPGTVPFIISGLRLAVGQALIGVFVSELSGATHGVGMLMDNAGQQFQTSVVFAGLVIFAVTGVILSWLLRRLERLVAAWRPASNH
jgi:ABC-type nitrate/sulfonate/bicarbonate transport system permease component